MQQAITRVDINRDLARHMVSLVYGYMGCLHYNQNKAQLTANNMKGMCIALQSPLQLVKENQIVI